MIQAHDEAELVACPQCKGTGHIACHDGDLEPDRDGMTWFEIHVKHCDLCHGGGQVSEVEKFRWEAEADQGQSGK